MLATPNNSSGTLNPEAHEFKYKSTGNPSKPGEESNENNSENGKKSKGKYNLKNHNYDFITFRFA